MRYETVSVLDHLPVSGVRKSGRGKVIRPAATAVGGAACIPAGPEAAVACATAANIGAEVAFPSKSPRREATNEYEAGVQKTETIIDGVVDLSVWAIVLLILIPWLIGLFMPQAKMLWRKKDG